MAELSQAGLNWCISNNQKNNKYMNNMKLILGIGLAYINYSVHLQISALIARSTSSGTVGFFYYDFRKISSYFVTGQLQDYN